MSSRVSRAKYLRQKDEIVFLISFSFLFFSIFSISFLGFLGWKEGERVWLEMFVVGLRLSRDFGDREKRRRRKREGTRTGVRAIDLVLLEFCVEEMAGWSTVCEVGDG